MRPDGTADGLIRVRQEHFQEKWIPVFRPKMRQSKNARAVLPPAHVKPL
jgi:hypothetical protein